uniref:Katanin p80 WD40 repeat-containing subunit B1 n=1 Tax=Clastoptera arizonana TaxID=38151 RepID=A0A1B6E1F0_9HEMI
MASTSKRSWKLQDFMAHGANVNCLSLGHKSGRVLVTGGDDKKVNLWAVGKDNCIMSLNGHTTPVDCVRFDPMEETVVAGSSAGALKIWDLEAVKIITTFTGHKAGIRSVDFHPYGDNLVSGSLDTSIKLWDTRYKGHICTYNVHRQTVNSVKFSPDGQWVASGGEDGLVKILDLRTRKVVTEFSGHSGSVTSVEYHPHEFLLCSASTDRTVKFWELENFSLVSTTDRDSTALRCVTFSPNGQCLYAGAQDFLKVCMWEPARTIDTVPISWGKVQDIAIANTQLIGASFRLTNVAVWVVDLQKIAPLSGSYTPESVNPFSYGQSTRKSFSKKTTPESTKNNSISTKTIEEVDLTESDAEEETLSTILNVNDYKTIFQPSRALTRSPPPTFPPPASDEDVSLTNLNCMSGSPELEEIESPISDSSIYTVHKSLSPPLSPQSSDSSPPRHRIGSPKLLVPVRPQREQLRRKSLCKDPELSPNSDTERSVKSKSPVRGNQDRLNSIQHSPSESSLTTRYSHNQTNSVKKTFDFKRPTNLNSSTKTQLLNTVNNSNTNVTVYIPKEKHTTSLVTNEEKEVDFVPMSLDKPSGIDFGDFLPQRSLGKFSIMSESEVTNSLLSHHQNMLAVLKTRNRTLQIVYNLWQNKDLKSAIDFAVDTNDLALLVDLLGVCTQRPTIWNLDICAAVLPSIFKLLQSKYETHMTVGCTTLRLILLTFSSVIKTNIMRPCPSLGVDISREERYDKCVKCYNSLVPIRAFVLKRQTMQGKLGQSFRELHTLLQQLGPD